MKKVFKINVFNKPLEICSRNPLTGYFRDGCCNSNEHDSGMHMICAKMSEDFLNFSFSRGNDLLTPKPEFNFPGLKSGDRWCLCTSRWLEAIKLDVAPKIILSATNKEVLKKISIEILKDYALDIN
tara:strand:+ start:688 stop:1065 length:378 start_codon:yes stop_codon:yes gene_type:complete